MKAEVVSVGTELLLGEITDTNATFICRKLAEAGIDVHFRHTVGDNLDRLCDVLATAFERADLVIVSGGIGPTNDDITREAVAAVLGVPLQEDPDVWSDIQAFFRARGYHMAPTNRKMAQIPRGGKFIVNRRGTAPGFIASRDGKEFIVVPGVPAEMRAMMEEAVMPHLLRRQTGRAPIIKSRTLRLAGIGESAATEKIEDILREQSDPTVAPYAHPGEVTLRITTKADSEPEADAKLSAMEQRLRERLGRLVFGVDDESLEAVVGRLLTQQRLTLALAESCTGGLVATRITDVSGSSDYFVGAVVAYSNAEKTRLLGVSEALLNAHGAVSAPVARAMAHGARTGAGADVALGITGIAGPTGATPQKPVGLVYVALAAHDETREEEHRLHGNRAQIKQRASQAALDMLRLWLLERAG
ncbi:MAG: competence/damage-inducible protein A [Armatimonadota bacterium]